MGEFWLRSVGAAATRVFNKRTLAGAVTAVWALALARPAEPACRERPLVLLDEGTAAQHLVSKRDPVLPDKADVIPGFHRVALLISVDRRGNVCDLRPLWGSGNLTGVALKTVKVHWSYRPFLLDRKPVPAQFPVTVNFIAPPRGPWRVARSEGRGTTRTRQGGG